MPNTTTPQRLAQAAGITGIMMAISEGFKHFLLPYLVPPILGSIVPPLAETIGQVFLPAPVEIVSSSAGRFPTIIGHIPFIKRFIPRWFLPFGDILSVAAVPTVFGFTGLAAFGIKSVFNFGVKTVLFGLAAPAANRAAHLLGMRNYLAQCANWVVGTPQPVNPYGLAHGVAGAFQEPVGWLNTLDPILRITMQATIYGGLAILALCAVGKNPFKAAPLVIDVLPPIDPKTVIIQEAANRMASFDYIIMLFMKVGLPVLGGLLVAAIIYNFYNLITSNTALQQTVIDQSVANADLQVKLDNPPPKVVKSRNSQGQFSAETGEPLEKEVKVKVKPEKAAVVV